MKKILGLQAPMELTSGLDNTTSDEEGEEEANLCQMTDHTKLKEIHQSKDIGSLIETTQNNEAYDTLKRELCLVNENVSKN